jgi:hypothetical protein
VARSFSDSIIGTTTIESLPHPKRKSVLVDPNGLMLTDLKETTRAHLDDSIARIEQVRNAQVQRMGY